MNEHATQKQQWSMMLQEHRRLMKEITDLRAWIDEVSELGIPHFGELGTKLQPVRDTFSQHFEAEEVGGYLAEALAVAPRFRDEAEELRLQHTEFLERFDQLICRLHECEPPFTSWQQACEELDALLTDIKNHEGRENAIAQSAFEDDIGCGD